MTWWMWMMVGRYTGSAEPAPEQIDCDPPRRVRALQNEEDLPPWRRLSPEINSRGRGR